MQPFFMGVPKSALFGVYHPPETVTANSTRSVLICPSIGDEYISWHWSTLRLAKRLQQSGFHVLRFDYFGTGDSAGVFSEATPVRWIEDIAFAARELRDLSGNRNLSLLGIRYGSILAAAAAVDIKPNRLVAVEPVDTGQTFITMLGDRDANRKTRFSGKFYDADDPLGVELAGFTYSDECLAQISRSDLKESVMAGDSRFDVVTTKLALEIKQIIDSCQQVNRDSSYHEVESKCDWNEKLVNLEQIQVPHRMLDKVNETLAT